MSDDVTTAATIASLTSRVHGAEADLDFANKTIASLRAEVERLKAELQGEREDVAACYKAKAALIDERDELRQALDTARSRAGVLEAEVKAWHAAEHLRKDEPHNEFRRLAEARARTRDTHALDAAKFGA